MLWDDQENPRAISTLREERGHLLGHRAFVVANDNSALLGCASQHHFVVQTIQSGSLGRLEIDAGLAAQRRIDDDSFQVVVRLESNAHYGLASC